MPTRKPTPDSGVATDNLVATALGTFDLGPVDEDGFRHARIPMTLLDNHGGNFRQHPPEQVERLRKSIHRFAQVRSIVVQLRRAEGRFTILAGHGITAGAAAAGVTHMKCDIVPEHWSAAECADYLAADNLHSAAALDDLEQLVLLLQDAAADGRDLETLGSSDDELESLLTELGRSIDSGPSVLDAPIPSLAAAALNPPPGMPPNIAQQIANQMASQMSGQMVGQYAAPGVLPNQYAPIASEASPASADAAVRPIMKLRFGSYAVPLTPEEFDALEVRLKLYMRETGSPYGFIHALIAGTPSTPLHAAHVPEEDAGDEMDLASWAGLADDDSDDGE